MLSRVKTAEVFSYNICRVFDGCVLSSRSRIEKARQRALLMLQGQDATVSVSRPSAAARSGSYQSGTAADSALYPPLVEKFYDVDTRGRHGRRTGRCARSLHAVVLL